MPLLGFLAGKIGWKWIATGLAAVAILAVAAGGYAFVTGMQAQLQRLAADNARLLDAARLAEQRGDALRQHVEDVARRSAENNRVLRQLAADSAADRSTVKELASTFARHDLRRLLDAETGRPGAMERRINNAAERARRLLEQSTSFRDHDRPGAAAPAD